MHIGLWSSRSVLPFLLLISLLRWVLVCIQTYDSLGGGGGPSSGKPALPKDARCLIRNKFSQTETQTHQRDCVCVRFSLWWGCQVWSCVGVERAAMGISRFMTLVRKLTNQSCFLFFSYDVNAAASCPWRNHSRPISCTDRGSDPLSLDLSFPVCVAVYISLSLSLSLSPYTAPPCLVRGQMYLSCWKGEAYTLSLPHMGKGIFPQRENWHTIIMF